MPYEPKYASILVDAETGLVLRQENADERTYPASTTKLMTLYLTFGALRTGKLKLSEAITVSPHAASMAPSKLGLAAGETVRVEDAILAITTKSANDMAVALAERIAGSEDRFAELMTAKAHAIGMSRTSFHNASGLPDAEQLTTARDLATLSRALIYDFPQYYRYFNQRTFTYGNTVFVNHNRLLGRYEGLDGLKTGYIHASGFNLAASAVRDGRRLIAVVLGGRTGSWRDARVAELLDEGFAMPRSRTTIARTGDGVPNARPAALMMVGAGHDERSLVPPRKPSDQDASEVAATPITAVATASPADVAGARGPLLPASAASSSELSVPHGLRLTSTAEAAEPSPASVAMVTAQGGWSVQVGAFADQASSRRAVSLAAEELPDLLGTATPNVVRVANGRGPLFRARFVGLDEKAAKAACAELEHLGHTCLALPPQGL